MNERIRELAEQAGRWCYDNYDIPTQERFQEKFAELIVRECISKCEFIAGMAEITNTGEIARKTKATANSCADMIAQHFGVEE